MDHDRSHVFSWTVQRRRKFVPSSFVRSCDVLAFAGGIAGDNMASKLPDLNITTKVPDHELYAWETLLSRTVNIIAPIDFITEGCRMEFVLLSISAMLLRGLAPFPHSDLTSSQC
jgi:hypothetical protein